MTMEGPDRRRHLVRKDGSLVIDGDGYARPIRMDELDPASARSALALLDAAESAERRKREAPPPE